MLFHFLIPAKLVGGKSNTDYCALGLIELIWMRGRVVMIRHVNVRNVALGTEGRVRRESE